MRISFLAGAANPGYEWGDWSYAEGIGGAEQCLILLARELVKLGHHVLVYNHCGDRSGTYQGVEYRNCCEWKINDVDGEDLVVSWRQPSLLDGLRGHVKQVWDWDHNIPVPPHLPTPTQMRGIDKMVFVSNWQMRQYMAAGIPAERCVNLGTAIDTRLFERTDVERFRGRVIAHFHPYRGLDFLRQKWAKVKAAVPHATLAPFWWQDEMFEKFPPVPELGILPMRHLSPGEVAEECLKAECFAYPATGTETASLCAIEAQAGGAIPVVVPVGGIHETLAGFGVETSHPYFAGDLANLLADTMRQQVMRGEMMARARAKYSWAEVAKRWTAELEKELKEHS